LRGLRLAEELEKSASLDRADLMVVLSENGSEDWSFGRGEMQYASLPSPAP
jgi:hypothetical protein